MIIAIILILGAAIGFVTFFVAKSILAPKRVNSIADLLKNNKNAAAARAAKKIILKEPRNADAHYLLGLAYIADDKSELALMEFQAVNEIGHFEGYTKELPFRKKIAELYEKFNQPEEALKEYLLLLKMEPENGDNYYNAGHLFEQRNKSDRAINYYRKALELDPRNSQARMRLGMLYYRAKRTADARTELEAAIKSQPDNYEAYYYLGKIQKELKEFIPALASFEKATKAPAFRAKALIERGGCYLSTGNNDAAIGELERAIKHIKQEDKNEILYARYFLATALERTRRIERAVEEWEKIYAVKPNFKDTATKLGEYQELRTDDHMKDYMTSSSDEFLEICTKVTQQLGLSVRDTKTVGEGCEIIGVESQSKWRNARKLPTMIRFLRVSDIVDESNVRALHEEMKSQNIQRGIIISSGGFARTAVEFAESRPIDLYNKDKLQELLKSAG
jgi:tetratricopeptide (TPR) repeat protein